MALLASNASISPGLVSLCAAWCGRTMLCLGDAMQVNDVNGQRGCREHHPGIGIWDLIKPRCELTRP